jgi:hypothetical protein
VERERHIAGRPRRTLRVFDRPVELAEIITEFLTER